MFEANFYPKEVYDKVNAGEKNIVIKSEALMKLEKAEVLWQDKKTGKWYPVWQEDVDLTPFLIKAGMFEH